MTPSAKILLGALSFGGRFVRGAEVRAARELVGFGLAFLEDNGGMKIDGRADGERWFVYLTAAGERHEDAKPIILVTQRDSDFHAVVQGTRGKFWGAGHSPYEAIGRMVAMDAAKFGVVVVLPTLPEAPPC